MDRKSTAPHPLTLAFQLGVNDEEDARAARLASLLSEYADKEGRRVLIRMSLDNAGMFRDVLFDLWELVGRRSGSMLRLGEEAIALGDLKEELAFLDRSSGNEAFPPRLLDGDGNKPASAGEPPRLQDAPPPEPAVAGKTTPHATYEDVGGLDDAVRTLRETVELPLKHPEVLSRLGVSPHRALLLHGPPGCGKTLLAKAVAHGAGAGFFPVSGPELITKWHGESEENLRKLFAEARSHQPSIIFFDEIDAVAQSRSSDESLRHDTRFTTQLLTLMDGIHDPGRVFILATTNRPDLLDPALLRPGRFDRLIEVPPPDRAGCLKILRIHARRLPLAGDVSLEAFAAELDGLTGADIAYLVREAAYACLRRTFDMDEVLAGSDAMPDGKLEGLRVSNEDFRVALAGVRRRNAAFEPRMPKSDEE